MRSGQAVRTHAAPRSQSAERRRADVRTPVRRRSRRLECRPHGWYVRRPERYARSPDRHGSPRRFRWSTSCRIRCRRLSRVRRPILHGRPAARHTRRLRWHRFDGRRQDRCVRLPRIRRRRSTSRRRRCWLRRRPRSSHRNWPHCESLRPRRRPRPPRRDHHHHRRHPEGSAPAQTPARRGARPGRPPPVPRRSTPVKFASWQRTSS